LKPCKVWQAAQVKTLQNEGSEYNKGGARRGEESKAKE